MYDHLADIENYVAHCQEPDFEDNEFVYDAFDLDTLAEGITVRSTSPPSPRSFSGCRAQGR